MAPIAQVAAETARSVEVVAADTRTRLAEAEQAAQRFRDAEGRGLVLREIPLEDIQEDALFRDRMTLDREELEELAEFDCRPAGCGCRSRSSSCRSRRRAGRASA